MDAVITTLVNLTIVPLTAPIPFMVSSGMLLVLFAGLWAAFGRALVTDRSALDAAWLRIRRLPLVAQALVWLLFLPPMAGLWIYRRPWRAAYRLTLIAGLAGWTLLVFLPNPLISTQSVVVSGAALVALAYVALIRPHRQRVLA